MSKAIGKLEGMAAVQAEIYDKMEEILNLLKSTPTLYLAAENIPIAGTCSIIIIEYDTMYYVLHNLNPQRLTS